MLAMHDIQVIWFLMRCVSFQIGIVIITNSFDTTHVCTSMCVCVCVQCCYLLNLYNVFGASEQHTFGAKALVLCGFESGGIEDEPRHRLNFCK